MQDDGWADEEEGPCCCGWAGIVSGLDSYRYCAPSDENAVLVVVPERLLAVGILNPAVRCRFLDQLPGALARSFVNKVLSLLYW